MSTAAVASRSHKRRRSSAGLWRERPALLTRFIIPVSKVHVNAFLSLQAKGFSPFPLKSCLLSQSPVFPPRQSLFFADIRFSPDGRLPESVLVFFQVQPLGDVVKSSLASSLQVQPLVALQSILLFLGRCPLLSPQVQPCSWLRGSAGPVPISGVAQLPPRHFTGS